MDPPCFHPLFPPPRFPGPGSPHSHVFPVQLLFWDALLALSLPFSSRDTTSSSPFGLRFHGMGSELGWAPCGSSSPSRGGGGTFQSIPLNYLGIHPEILSCFGRKKQTLKQETFLWIFPLSHFLMGTFWLCHSDMKFSFRTSCLGSKNPTENPGNLQPKPHFIQFFFLLSTLE